MLLKNINIKRIECLKSWLLSNIMAREELMAMNVIENIFNVLAN